MNLGLSGKVAVVTGASKGIGLAITKMLVEEGAQVVAGARTVDGLAGLPGVTARQLDLAAPDGPAKLVAAALEAHGRLDVLVNNVGAVRLRLGGFLGTSDEEFEWSMQMNFMAAVRATRAALGPMLKPGAGAGAGGGSIVNVASVNAFFEPDAGVLDYGAAKAALVNFTKSIAMEFGPRGVRVNAVSPGPVSTDLWLGKGGVADTVAQATGTDAQQAREKIVAGLGGFATGRFSTPEDVATLVVLLASERTKNVTGSNYVIDGGLIKTT
jgi:NAD(P)-dependent dehydrogenase (short-subunit alcohol dehydrogenase family)